MCECPSNYVIMLLINSFFPGFMGFLLQSHRSHHVHAFLSSHHFSLVDCLHLLLGGYCRVSFRVITSNNRKNVKRNTFRFSGNILYFSAKRFTWRTLAHVKTCICETLHFPKDRIGFSILQDMCVFNQHCEPSYLASSGEAVYKVMSPDGSCPYANSTCNPEVQYIITCLISL